MGVMLKVSKHQGQDKVEVNCALFPPGELFSCSLEQFDTSNNSWVCGLPDCGITTLDPPDKDILLFEMSKGTRMTIRTEHGDLATTVEYGPDGTVLIREEDT